MKLNLEPSANPLVGAVVVQRSRRNQKQSPVPSLRSAPSSSSNTGSASCGGTHSQPSTTSLTDARLRSTGTDATSLAPSMNVETLNTQPVQYAPHTTALTPASTSDVDPLWQSVQVVWQPASAVTSSSLAGATSVYSLTAQDGEEGYASTAPLIAEVESGGNIPGYGRQCESHLPLTNWDYDDMDNASTPPPLVGQLFPRWHMAVVIVWVVLVIALQSAMLLLLINTISSTSDMFSGLVIRVVCAIIVWRTLPNLGNCRPIYEYKSYVACMSAWILGAEAPIPVLLTVLFEWDLVQIPASAVPNIRYLIFTCMTVVGFAVFVIQMFFGHTPRGALFSVMALAVLNSIIHIGFINFTTGITVGSVSCFLGVAMMAVVYSAPYPAKGFFWLAVGIGPWYIAIFVFMIRNYFKQGVTYVNVSDHTMFFATLGTSLTISLSDLGVFIYIYRWLSQVQRLASTSRPITSRAAKIYFSNFAHGSTQYLSILDRNKRALVIVGTWKTVANTIGLVSLVALINPKYGIIDLCQTVLLWLGQVVMYYLILYNEQPSWRSCPAFKTALEFIGPVVSPEYLDEAHHKCLCPRRHCTSHIVRLSTQQSRGACFWRGPLEHSRKFSLPRGWHRIGLQVDPTKARKLAIFEEYNVCYHGTTIDRLESILQHQTLLIPGDVKLDGGRLPIRDGHIPGQEYVYTSPTIAYAAQPHYATPVLYTLPSGETVQARVVLECREYPSAIQVQGETINWARLYPGRKIDPHFDNDSLEWYTGCRVAVVFTGILIHFGPFPYAGETAGMEASGPKLGGKDQPLYDVTA